MSFFVTPASVRGWPPPPLQATADSAMIAARTDVAIGAATRGEWSARTLGWGKPMVIGRAFLTKKNSGKSRRESVSGKGRGPHPDPQIILRALANRIYDHL
jgi:hypothetical protein